MIFNEKLSQLAFKDYATMLNAACGFVAIALFLSNQREAGMALVVIAAALDFLDGKIARLLGKDASNDFGRELDSLADAVSFGAAPAALVLADHGFELLPLVVAVFYLCAGITRLALFNLQGKDEKGVYRGMAIPVAALLVVGAHAFLFPYATGITLLAAFAMLAAFKYSKKELKKATHLPLVFD
ncbi:MAG: CDP-diacylglycerol--serine O-phosphatidyltransferase [Candidatus Micrarchaeia archaeon]|jgi:CDP-diacylglycerol--serine O-phosphatidyltransferase